MTMADKIYQAKKMAEEERNFARYQYGALASVLANSKESKRYAPSALEILAGKKGLNLGEEALGFVRGTQASEEGIQTAINVYAQNFKEKRGKYKPVELADWYTPVLSDLDEQERKKVVEYLGKHDENLGSIEKKVAEADYILSEDAPEGLFTDKQKSEARETIEKYGKLISILNVLDTYKFESLRPDAVNTTRKKDLKNLASKL